MASPLPPRYRLAYRAALRTHMTPLSRQTRRELEPRIQVPAAHVRAAIYDYLRERRAPASLRPPEEWLQYRIWGRIWPWGEPEYHWARQVARDLSQVELSVDDLVTRADPRYPLYRSTKYPDAEHPTQPLPLP